MLNIQGHGENFQSYKFLPLVVNQTAPRIISEDSPGPNSLDIYLTIVMGKCLLTIHAMLHFSFKFLPLEIMTNIY